MKSTQQTPKVPPNKPSHQFYSDSVALHLKNQDSSLDDIIKAQDIESSGKEPDITDNDSSSPYCHHHHQIYKCTAIPGLSGIECKKSYIKDDFEDDEEKSQSESEARIIVEKSPKGRFHRFNEELGSGAQKRVYLAYDYDNGREVAWNAINVSLMNDEAIIKIKEEIELLKMLKHPNIISFIYGFYNENKKEIIIITELFSGGSLRHYLSVYKKPRLRVIKLWCCEILKGLKYLHEFQTPIIHRDIKCDNIFINTSTGEVKIGDLGFSRMLTSSGYCKTFSGTAEFCSPEVYIGKYGVKADIYSFGMCVLEMVTNEKPYKECEGNVLSICEKATKQIMPLIMGKIKNEKLKNFITWCLKPENERPSASELLQSEFINDLDSEENKYPALFFPLAKSNSSSVPESSNISQKKKNLINENTETIKQSKTRPIPMSPSSPSLTSLGFDLNHKNMGGLSSLKESSQNEITIMLNKEEESNEKIAKIILNKKNKGKTLKIKFNYSFETDTIEGVINELQKVIILSLNEQKEIGNKLTILLNNFQIDLKKNIEYQKKEIESLYACFNKNYLQYIKEAQNILNSCGTIRDLKPHEIEDFEKKKSILEELLRLTNG